MPKISVLTISARNLYRDEQINSLESQSFKDFEWVFVDGIYERVMNARFPITQIQDKGDGSHRAGQAYNKGLVHCGGELVYFLADYVLPHPDCLGRHWEIYHKYKNVMISGRSARVECTPNELNLSIRLTEAKDYRKGIKEERTQIEEDLFEVTPTLSMTWWSGRNDSAPLEALLACNGFEEDLDGRWGGHDGEMANRLVTYGLRYLQDMKSMCLEFYHHSAQMKAVRTAKEHLELAKNLSEGKHEKGIYTSNLKRSLRKEREEWKP